MNTITSHPFETVPVFIHIPAAKLDTRAGQAAAWSFRNQLIQHFGGYTITGQAKGAWQDTAGQIHRDSHAVYLVTVAEPSEIGLLQHLVTALAARLGEYCIFVLIGGSCPRTQFWWAEAEPRFETAALETVREAAVA